MVNMRGWLESKLLVGALLVAGSSTAGAQELTPGRYLAAENGEEDVERLVEIGADQQMTVSRLGQSASRPPVALSVTSLGSGRFRGTVPGDDDAVQLLVQTSNRILFWEEGDGEIGLLRRLEGTAPEALLGQWEALNPDGGAVEWQATIFAERIVIQRESGTLESQLWVFSPEGPTHQLAFAQQPDGEPWIYHFQPLPEGGFLAWQEGGDDFVVLQRPGQRPSWIASEPRPETVPPRRQ